jgi:hypothetical protein
MLIEGLAGLVLVRRRTVAFRFGDAMSESLFGGVPFGGVAFGALAGDSQIDDLSHGRARMVQKARECQRMVQQSLSITPIRWRR